MKRLHKLQVIGLLIVNDCSYSNIYTQESIVQCKQKMNMSSKENEEKTRAIKAVSLCGQVVHVS